MFIRQENNRWRLRIPFKPERLYRGSNNPLYSIKQDKLILSERRTEQIIGTLENITKM